MHSKQATRALEDSLASAAQTPVDDALSGAMADLHHAVGSAPGPEDAHGSPPTISSQPNSLDEDHGLSALPMPPTDLVLRLLRYAKVEPQTFFGDFPALDTTAMIGYCQKVFFATEPYSIATFIMVNAGLISMLQKLDRRAQAELQISPSELERHRTNLSENVEVAVQKLPLLTTQSTDNITAIFLAALSAGWHRLVKKRDDADQRRQRVVFWLIYAMDRALSLSLGRAPMIQDYDIQTDRLSYPDDVPGPQGYLMVLWMDVGELQGHIYLELYSVQAQRQSAHVKADAARRLAARCLKIQETMYTVSTACVDREPRADSDQQGQNLAPVPGRVQEALQSQEIIFQSLLTLIYRMIPPTHSNHPLQFCDDCVQAARAALNLHNRAWQEMAARGAYDWRVFIHWSTLFSPFVPFISVFGNTIAQSDTQDLALLGAFVSTLGQVVEQSHAVSKLHRACSSFHEIARVFLAQQSRHGAPLGDRAEDVDADCQSIDNMAEHSLQPLPDFSLSQEEWDVMLSEWDLGLGTEDARQMSSFLDLLPNAQ
ncbi:MAG: hypothetical protein Q9206_005416 [Seirophora lacunosa]